MSALLWHLFVVAVLLAGGSLLGTWVGELVRAWLARTELDPVVRRLFVGWVRPIFLIFAALAALNYLQVDMTSAIAVLGAATLAIGMSLQGSLSNVAAGALVLTTRPYRGGDVVEIAGHTGSVTEMTLFHTVLHIADGREVVIPNNKVIAGPIVNISTRGTRRIDLVLTVDAKADLDKVEKVFLVALGEDERTLDEPAPSFSVVDMLPYGVSVKGSAWTKTADFGAARAATFRAVLAGLKSARIAVATTGREA